MIEVETGKDPPLRLGEFSAPGRQEIETATVARLPGYTRGEFSAPGRQEIETGVLIFARGAGVARVSFPLLGGRKLKPKIPASISPSVQSSSEFSAPGRQEIETSLHLSSCLHSKAA